MLSYAFGMAAMGYRDSAIWWAFGRLRNFGVVVNWDGGNGAGVWFGRRSWAAQNGGQGIVFVASLWFGAWTWI